jgi:hypothetical protein
MFNVSVTDDDASEIFIKPYKILLSFSFDRVTHSLHYVVTYLIEQARPSCVPYAYENERNEAKKTHIYSLSMCELLKTYS